MLCCSYVSLNRSWFTGLEPAVFAALVPNSADKPLEELIEEIMGDHEMMVSLVVSPHNLIISIYLSHL